MDKRKLDIKFNWKSKKNIPIYLMMVYFLFVLTVYFQNGFWQVMKKPSTTVIILIWIIMSVISMLEISKVRSVFQKHAIWVNGLVLLISPIASFLVVELMVSNYNMNMFKAYSLYNLIWYVIIYLLLFALIRNYRLAIIIGNIVIYLAAFINYLVFLFRGNPILPSDLLAWQTGMSVASNYDLSFTEGFLTATLIMYVILLLSFKLEKPHTKISIFNRFIGAGIYMIFAVSVFHQFFDTDLIQSKIRVIDFFAPKYTYCAYGTAFGFVANVEAMDTKAPEGYSIEQVREALEQVEPGSNQALADQEKPNIIAVMNEAFSDLSMIGDFATNMDYLPYIRSLEENATKGTMYVSVFGGATSDTEYEFLTGNSMAVMPQNCVPYQQFVTEPTDSLASILKEQGYYNIAIHPYAPSGYKRDLVYPLLGFDEFLSIENFEDPELIRTYISDKESYQKIIEQYESKGEEDPLFIFNVTMQNHGGYSNARVFDEENTVTLKDLQGYEDVEQYLSLLRESDKAFQSLIDYFSKQEEHTIILMFGDHQPVVYNQLHDLLDGQTEIPFTQSLEKKYRVPFILWANYDISEDDVDKISANYLSSYLLQTAELKGSRYNAYLMELFNEVPVINALFYIDKENMLHKFSEVTAYSEFIKEYRYIGYNNALDKKGKLKELFSEY